MSLTKRIRDTIRDTIRHTTRHTTRINSINDIPKFGKYSIYREYTNEKIGYVEINESNYQDLITHKYVKINSDKYVKINSGYEEYLHLKTKKIICRNYSCLSNKKTFRWKEISSPKTRLQKVKENPSSQQKALNPRSISTYTYTRIY